MCDYSMSFVDSRPAKVGDNLVSTHFAQSTTRGFAAVGEPEVAVCLLPGTELAFEKEVLYRYVFEIFGTAQVDYKVARFCQINLDDPRTHHDALEFPNGQTVLITRLLAGQTATVLQMPRSRQEPRIEAKARAQERAL
jgi:hypothetical protein